MTNYAEIIEKLTPTTDIFGNTLAVGDLVRSFDTPMLYQVDVEPLGMDIGCNPYVEGTIVEIGAPYPGQNCRAYKIKAQRRVDIHDDGELHDICPDNATFVFAPVNGTKSHGVNTFGVIKVMEPNPDKNFFSKSGSKNTVVY